MSLHLRIKVVITLLCVCTAVIYGTDTLSAYAAANDYSSQIINKGTGIGGKFDQDLIALSQAFVTLAKIIGVSMTLTGFIMWMWGVESFPKMALNWMLGVGLASNFGALLVGSGIESYVSALADAQAGGGGGALAFPVDLKEGNAGGMDVLSQFMAHLLNNVIKPGSVHIMPICLKLLMILTVVQGSYEVAFKLISGDKLKYMMSILIKVGIIIFLEENWIGGMGLVDALSQGFQEIGYTMGAGNSNIDLQADSIANNAVVLWEQFNLSENGSLKSPGLLIINAIALVVMTGLLFLTAIDMFMARIEYYVMALLVMPLLPCMITSKFSFLSDKAIGLMLNLALKVCAISFITALTVPFFNSYIDEMKQVEDLWTSTGVVLQIVLASLIIFILTKRISSIVSGLLSGQPSLSGSDMMGQLQQAGRAVATRGGSIAGNIAGAGEAAKYHPKGWLANIGKSAAVSAIPGKDSYIDSHKRTVDLFKPK